MENLAGARADGIEVRNLAYLPGVSANVTFPLRQALFADGVDNNLLTY